MSDQSEKEIKKTIENLIKAGTSFNMVQLDIIYHNDLQVIMINETGEKMILNKQEFKDLFASKRSNGDASLNTWREYHHVESHGLKGQVILSRKVNLTGTEQKIVLSIDLVKEENRWQVIREVIIIQRKK